MSAPLTTRGGAEPVGNEAPLGDKPLWNTPGAHLPGPFRSLVRHLMHDGDKPMTKQHAIAAAWWNVRKWAAAGKPRWVKVLADLEAARAKARATPNKSERGVSASRSSDVTEVLMAGSSPTKNSPPAQGGKNTPGGAGKGNGGSPPKPGGSGAKTVADIRNAVAAVNKLPPALRDKALERVRAQARGIPGALAFVPGSGGSGDKK